MYDGLVNAFTQTWVSSAPFFTESFIHLYFSYKMPQILKAYTHILSALIASFFSYT